MSAVTHPRGAIADVNVTPMADIVIVLLIILMVMTPIVGRGPVKDLPPASHPREAGETRVEVSLPRDGSVYLDSKPLRSARELLPRLRQRLAPLPEGDRIVHLKADESVSYEAVRGLLSSCREAGAEEVVLMTSTYRR